MLGECRRKSDVVRFVDVIPFPAGLSQPPMYGLGAIGAGNAFNRVARRDKRLQTRECANINNEYSTES